MTKITDEMVEAAARVYAGTLLEAAFEGDAESEWDRLADVTRAALTAALAAAVQEGEAVRKFTMGQRVRKHSGAWWEGAVVGFYSTEQTPIGYCVQLDMVQNGPVQLYPEAALVEAHPAPADAGVVDPKLRDFLGKVQGVCMGVAMSGRDHPNPDGVLMELVNEAQEILFPPCTKGGE